MDLGCFHKYIAFYAYINCCKTNSSWTKSLRDGLPRLWRSDLVQLVKIGVQSRGMGRYILNVVCFFLCPDADCLRNNLYGAIKSLRKESKVVQTKKQYGDFSLTALSFASISIFSGWTKRVNSIWTFNYDTLFIIG